MSRVGKDADSACAAVCRTALTDREGAARSGGGPASRATHWLPRWWKKAEVSSGLSGMVRPRKRRSQSRSGEKMACYYEGSVIKNLANSTAFTRYNKRK